MKTTSGPVKKPYFGQVHQAFGESNFTRLTTFQFAKESIVNVKVGQAERNFGIHKDLRARHSSYFTGALDGGFKASQEWLILLPEDNPDVFELFADWLYTPAIRLAERRHERSDDLAEHASTLPTSLPTCVEFHLSRTWSLTLSFTETSLVRLLITRSYLRCHGYMSIPWRGRSPERCSLILWRSAGFPSRSSLNSENPSARNVFSN